MILRRLGSPLGDRVGSGIQTLVRELLAQGYDLVFELPSRAVRAPLGRRDRGSRPASPFGIEPANELVDPPAGDPVVPSHFGLRAPLNPDRGDDQPSKLVCAGSIPVARSPAQRPSSQARSAFAAL